MNGLLAVTAPLGSSHGAPIWGRQVQARTRTWVFPGCGSRAGPWPLTPLRGGGRLPASPGSCCRSYRHSGLGPDLQEKVLNQSEQRRRFSKGDQCRAWPAESHHSPGSPGDKALQPPRSLPPGVQSQLQPGTWDAGKACPTGPWKLASPAPCPGSWRGPTIQMVLEGWYIKHTQTVGAVPPLEEWAASPRAHGVDLTDMTPPWAVLAPLGEESMCLSASKVPRVCSLPLRTCCPWAAWVARGIRATERASFEDVFSMSGCVG